MAERAGSFCSLLYLGLPGPSATQIARVARLKKKKSVSRKTRLKNFQDSTPNSEVCKSRQSKLAPSAAKARMASLQPNRSCIGRVSVRRVEAAKFIAEVAAAAPLANKETLSLRIWDMHPRLFEIGEASLSV